MTIEQIAKTLGATPDQIKAQFGKNAKQLAEMAHKAAGGKKVNGYTDAQLRDMAEKARLAAQ